MHMALKGYLQGTWSYNITQKGLEWELSLKYTITFEKCVKTGHEYMFLKSLCDWIFLLTDFFFLKKEGKQKLLVQ